MREFLFYNCFMYINKKNPTIIAAAWYNRNKNSSCSRLSFLTIVFNDLVWKTLTNVSKLSWCYLSDGKLVKSSHRAVSDDFPLVYSTFLHQLFLSTIILTDSATHTLWVRMGGGGSREQLLVSSCAGWAHGERLWISERSEKQITVRLMMEPDVQRAASPLTVCTAHCGSWQENHLMSVICLPQA